MKETTDVKLTTMGIDLAKSVALLNASFRLGGRRNQRPRRAGAKYRYAYMGLEQYQGTGIAQYGGHARRPQATP